MERRMKLSLVAFVAMAMFAVTTMATIQDDEKECAEQLTNLAACIPYVSGSANKPTQQCCDDTKQLKSEKPKCLCVLIKESTDPSMGLPINTTLALKMPSACNIDAKVSDCPTLLKLDPDSPDAKIFKDASTDSTSSATPSSSTTSPSDSGSSSSASTTAGSGSKVTPTSSDGAKLKLMENGVASGLIVCSIAWMFYVIQFSVGLY